MKSFARWRTHVRSSPGGPRRDLVFVVAAQNRGWVLDGICRDTAARMRHDVEVVYTDEPLPAAQSYFFSHYSLWLEADRVRSPGRSCVNLAYYTHPRDVGVSRRRLVRSLSRTNQVLSMASMHAEQLVGWGLPPERVSTVLAAADPDLFQPGSRAGSAVGLVSAYYERKQPARVLELVQTLPDERFLLVGRGWRAAPFWDKLAALPNLDYVEPGYAEYPALYREMAVFVSLSSLEGGPIPLLEAMMTDVVPVATMTGFAPDVIQHGRNGFLCPVHAPICEVAALVAEARRARLDVRPSVAHLDWARYAALLAQHARLA